MNRNKYLFKLTASCSNRILYYVMARKFQYDVQTPVNQDEWCLSNEMINTLENEKRDSVINVESNIKYSLLCDKIKECQVPSNKTFNEDHFSVFNDYLQEAIKSPVKTESLTVEKAVKIAEYNQSHVLKELQKSLMKNETSIREIIDIISIIPNEELESNLVMIWNKLNEKSDKQKFVKLLSAHPSSSALVCKKILLPELKKEDTFKFSLDVVIPNLQLLQSQAVSDLLIPLLIEEDSFVFGEIQWLKSLLPLLSASQKSEFLSYYIRVMEVRTEKSHLIILSGLLEEMPLNQENIVKLVELFSRIISDFIDDRSLGKILLSILDSNPSGLTSNSMKELSHICKNYKGVMKFKINALLKKIITN